MRIVAAVVVVLLSVPRPSFAWGFEAHKFIAEQMIALLPRRSGRCSSSARRTSSSAPSIPTCGATSSRKRSPNHFVDLDYFGKYPFTELPHEYDRAVQKWGREVVHEQGLLPWRTAEIYGKLQHEFEGLKRDNAPGYLQDNIALYSAIVAHYVGDGHVPLHSVVNYDGQRTNQHGHSQPLGVRAVRSRCGRA